MEHGTLNANLNNTMVTNKDDFQSNDEKIMGHANHKKDL